MSKETFKDYMDDMEGRPVEPLIELQRILIKEIEG